MKIKLLTATLAAILCLTACGDADTKTSSESKADTTTTAATEEVTTEAVTEEVTTETTPAVETTVTTTEATTTTSATTTTAPAPAEPEKEEFKLAEGLSEKYVDFDNMALEFNGHIFRFGEATVQDLLDAGVELFTDADLDKQYADDVEAQVKITDSIRADLIFRRINGISGAYPREYVLDECRVVLMNSYYDELPQDPNYGEGMVHLNILLNLTKDELFENSGEPLKVSMGDTPSFMSYDYTGYSVAEPDNSEYRSRIKVNFYNDMLAEFRIDAHEYIRD